MTIHTRRAFLTSASKVAAATALGAAIPSTASARIARVSKRTLRFANAGGANSLLGETLARWAKLATERSSGELQIQAYVDGQLGAEAQVFDEIREGSVDGAVTAQSYLEELVPQYNVFDLPFLVSSLTQHKAFMATTEVSQMLALSERHGLKSLAWNCGGVEGVLSKTSDPITTLKEVKGVKIRTIDEPLLIKFWSLMGATPVPLATTEIYTSFETGVITASDTAIDYSAAEKYYEVTKSFSCLYQRFQAGIFYMNLKAFNSLPPHLQQVLLDTAQETADWSYGDLARINKSGLTTFRKAGLRVATNVDRAPWLKRSQPLYDLYKPVVGKKLLAEVVGAARALA